MVFLRNVIQRLFFLIYFYLFLVWEVLRLATTGPKDEWRAVRSKHLNIE